MTVEAQRPTGNPGTAPRGPAGPAPEPHGPKTPVRPAEPPKPAAPSKGCYSGALLAIDTALSAVEVVAAKRLPVPSDQTEASGQAILAFRLGRARAAVADLLTYSGRDGKDIAAAMASRPVQPPAGQPPLSGEDFLLPRDVRVPLVAALNRRAD